DGSTSDLVGPAPSTNGDDSVSWLVGTNPAWPCGIRWESHAAKGGRGAAFWGGETSRLAVMYFEWAGLASSSPRPAPARTDVLAKTVAWLLGRRPPAVTWVAPAPGAVVTSDALTLRYSIAAETGRTIIDRTLSYSLDGGESWTKLQSSPT